MPSAKVTVTGTIVTPDGAPPRVSPPSRPTRRDSTLNRWYPDRPRRRIHPECNPPGAYRFVVEFLGYATQSIEAEISKTTDLGSITVSPDGLDLETVEVRADKSRMELKLDKKVFNVGKDALAQGGGCHQRYWPRYPP